MGIHFISTHFEMRVLTARQIKVVVLAFLVAFIVLQAYSLLRLQREKSLDNFDTNPVLCTWPQRIKARGVHIPTIIVILNNIIWSHAVNHFDELGRYITINWTPFTIRRK